VRWLADECVDAGLVSRLRGAGHDVSYMAEMSSGASDADVLRQAESERGSCLLRTRVSATSSFASGYRCLESCSCA